MKNAEQIYSALLKLYPGRYRKAFEAQMMQTFRDQSQDIAASEGRVPLVFWLSLVADELKNIARQQRACLLDDNVFLRMTVTESLVSAALFLPLCGFFLAAFVKAALALPHPHVSGPGVPAALAALLLLSGLFSAAASRALAAAVARVLPVRRAGSV